METPRHSRRCLNEQVQREPRLSQSRPRVQIRRDCGRFSPELSSKRLKVSVAISFCLFLLRLCPSVLQKELIKDVLHAAPGRCVLGLARFCLGFFPRRGGGLQRRGERRVSGTAPCEPGGPRLPL